MDAFREELHHDIMKLVMPSFVGAPFSRYELRDRYEGGMMQARGTVLEATFWVALDYKPSFAWADRAPKSTGYDVPTGEGKVMARSVRYREELPEELRRLTS